MLKKAYWRLRIVLLALWWVGQINLGNTVLYKGKRYTVVNGVISNCWSLSNKEEYLEAVPRSEVKKEKTLANYWHSFSSGYRFYMRNWYRIWLHSGIEPWMKACTIWPKWGR